MRRLLLLLLILSPLCVCADGVISVYQGGEYKFFVATHTADSIASPRIGFRDASGTSYVGLTQLNKATGGTLSLVEDASGTWVCHTFLTSGDFEVIDAVGIATCEYLIVAGGGGGGRNTANNSRSGGGGGAGGFLSNIGTSTPITLSAGTNAVVVGAGGVRSPTQTGTASNGGDSSALSLVAVGGGYGGSAANTLSADRNGADGGSGGGAGGGDGITNIPGTAGTSGQGFAGGDGKTASAPNAFAYGGGGGGGAGAVGDSAVAGRNGGIGSYTYIRGISEAYAGGGGAGHRTTGNTSLGAGGIGGGGSAGILAGTSGAANTGGGGGASRSIGGIGGTGGSGIVIVRYLIEE